jgi:hypothetical protein
MANYYYCGGSPDNYLGMVIPFLCGRPNRDLIINEDDICNLKIAFGITNTIDELIKII